MKLYRRNNLVFVNNTILKVGDLLVKHINDKSVTLSSTSGSLKDVVTDICSLEREDESHYESKEELILNLPMFFYL